SDVDLSFAFADVLGSDPQETATTIAQESAHGFGLSHVDDMADVMYPMVNRYANGFQNKRMRIFDLGGSSDCTATRSQTSYTLLQGNVGAAPPDTTAPTIAVTAPTAGATLPSGFMVSFDAADDRALQNVDLIVNGAHYGTRNLPPWSWDVPAGTF